MAIPGLPGGGIIYPGNPSISNLKGHLWLFGASFFFSRSPRKPKTEKELLIEVPQTMFKEKLIEAIRTPRASDRRLANGAVPKAGRKPRGAVKMGAKRENQTYA